MFDIEHANTERETNRRRRKNSLLCFIAREVIVPKMQSQAHGGTQGIQRHCMLNHYTISRPNVDLSLREQRSSRLFREWSNTSLNKEMARVVWERRHVGGEV